MTTILVVDDEPSILRLVQRILAQTGYTVLIAESGAEALAIASVPELVIHLLLCDVMLPGMLGTILAGIIKEERPDMRVVLMSGKTDGELTVWQAGGGTFLGKPFPPAQLLACIHRELSSIKTTEV